MPLRLVNAVGDDLLTKREQEVVQWAAEGLSNREIASRLGLSENTVKNYLFRVFEKLGISSRVELILYAVTQLTNVPGTGTCEAKPALDTEESLFALCYEAAKHFITPQRALADMYRNGRGVARDPETAYMWFWIAENLSGQIEATTQDAMQDLERELSLEQIEAGRRRASEWINKHPSFSASIANGEVPESNALAVSREKSLLRVRGKHVSMNENKLV
jgi:DNA-binding CsgD family transcriptional regulator